MSEKKAQSWWQRPQALLSLPLLALLYTYKYCVSPALHMMAPGGGCRFEPTCSEYAIQSVRLHGPFRGGWLALKRLAKCHPWGACGYDPVPAPRTCQCHVRPHS